MSNPSPFDFVNSISDKSGNMIAEDPEMERHYQPFVVNRAFSNRPDTIMMANLMNEMPHLPKRMQYDFYYGMVRKSRKYSKWAKADKNPDEDVVMEAYGISRRRAREYLALMTDADIAQVRARVDKGGKK
jgi:hypothetical protein